MIFGVDRHGPGQTHAVDALTPPLLLRVTTVPLLAMQATFWFT
jgi:hypothetical protein